MKKLTLLLPVLVILLGGQLLLADAKTVTGNITDVIVYRGQALVTRAIEADLPKGTSEIIVDKLPANIIPESLYSQTTDGTTILSVRYREKTIKEDTRKEVKELEEKIEKIRTEHRLATKNQQFIAAQLRRVEKLVEFSLAAEQKDLNRGLLQFEPIKEMSDYVESKTTGYNKQLIETGEKIIQLDKELKTLSEKRQRLAAGHSRTQREAVIFMSRTKAGPAAIEINYLVNGANWSPQYNLRADTGKAIATIEYNAVVHQSSGETWNNASLALSTAQPNMVASPPFLEPMRITIGEISASRGRRDDLRRMPVIMSEKEEQQGMPQQQVFYDNRSDKFKSLIQSRNKALTKGLEANYVLNNIAFENQIMEFQADKEMLKQMKSQSEEVRRTEGVSVMYRIPGKLTLPSRSDQQLLTIAIIPSKADFTLMATPLLTDYVYLQGEILNDSDTILLPGPASTYRDGQFVGKAQMDLVTIGQKFTTGFGVDSQIQVTREFKDKKVDTLWGNRIDDHKYRIEISNYKTKPVKLRLLERLPYTENPNIEILLKKPSLALSTDKEYVRTSKKKGMLRWDLTLKPQTSGEKTTVIEYGFTMKYDNDMQVRPVRNANQ